MDLLVATNSVPLAQADFTPPAGTPQWATAGKPGATPAVPPTQIPAYHYNHLVQEIINLIQAGGETPSAEDLSQITKAVKALIAASPGRLVSVQRFPSSGTYNKTPGVTKILVPRAVGAGGAGAGSTAPGSALCSTCSGGATGGWVKDVWFDVSTITSAAVAIGEGATGGAGNGGTGGATSLSSSAFSLLCPGGGGGYVKQDATTVAFDVSAQSNGGATPTITNALDVGNSSGGVPGLVGLLFAGSVVSGQGASCPFGAGGLNTNGGNGGNATGCGAGGGGAAVQANGSTVTGGAGANGYLEIWEFTGL